VNIFILEEPNFPHMNKDRSTIFENRNLDRGLFGIYFYFGASHVIKIPMLFLTLSSLIVNNNVGNSATA
jgi:hypothetical protein